MSAGTETRSSGSMLDLAGPTATDVTNSTLFATSEAQAHARRRERISKSHPELVAKLTHVEPGTAIWVWAIVALQLALSYAMWRFDASWWWIFAIAW